MGSLFCARGLIMEHISNFLNTSSLNVKREENQKANIIDPHVADIVNKLFAMFYGICRGFEKQYPHESKRLSIEKTHWMRAFMDIGFNTLEQIELGIKKCRLESPINTPTIGQFVKWCTPTPEELGIPRVEEAYAQACSNSGPDNPEKKWTHQAVYHAWAMCNSYELANLPKKSTFPIFERNYDITVKMIISGQSLKKIPKALTHDEDSMQRQQITKGFEQCNSRQAAMEVMSKMLGKKIDGRINQGRMQKIVKQAGI